MKYSEGTRQQQAEMDTFRLAARRMYTKKEPARSLFASGLAMLETQLRRHWSSQQSHEFMAFLVNASWDFISPWTFVEDWTKKAIEAIQKGMSYEELKASGLFESDGSLYPIDNIPDAHRIYHELMIMEEQHRATPGLSLKDRISLLRKDLGWKPHSN